MIKGKDKGHLDTCWAYSAAYMSQTRGHPFIARASGQLDPRCS